MTQVVESCRAGVLASMASNPIDVVKTRVMNMKVTPGEALPYRGVLDCAVKTVRAEGTVGAVQTLCSDCDSSGPVRDYTVSVVGADQEGD